MLILLDMQIKKFVNTNRIYYSLLTKSVNSQSFFASMLTRSVNTKLKKA